MTLEQFVQLLSDVKDGYDWSVIMNLLESEQHLIEGQVYQSLLSNPSACFFFNQLIIPDTMGKERAGELIKSINTTMTTKTNVFMSKLQLTKLIVKQLPDSTTEF